MPAVTALVYQATSTPPRTAVPSVVPISYAVSEVAAACPARSGRTELMMMSLLRVKAMPAPNETNASAAAISTGLEVGDRNSVKANPSTAMRKPEAMT